MAKNIKKITKVGEGFEFPGQNTVGDVVDALQAFPRGARLLMLNQNSGAYYDIPASIAGTNLTPTPAPDGRRIPHFNEQLTGEINTVILGVWVEGHVDITEADDDQDATAK